MKTFDQTFPPDARWEKELSQVERESPETVPLDVAAFRDEFARLGVDVDPTITKISVLEKVLKLALAEHQGSPTAQQVRTVQAHSIGEVNLVVKPKPSAEIAGGELGAAPSSLL